MTHALDRRELLRQLALLSAGWAAACRGEAPSPSAPPDTGHAGHAGHAAGAHAEHTEGAHALLPPQRALLAAALARILPTDQDPGAAEADVIEYVDRELARPEYAVVKANVLAGLTALGRLSVRATRSAFEALSPAEQDRVLQETQHASERGKDFVFILTVLALEGFLGDPRWGGNKGGVGWKFIGYGPCSVDGETPEHGHH